MSASLTAAMRTRLLARAEARVEARRDPMDEDAFRGFYERTSRPLWAYLARCTGDRHLADDLLQETYYRLLRTSGNYADEAHRRNALFRIATNLMADARRHDRRVRHTPLGADEGGATMDRTSAERTDLARAMAKLRPTQRKMVWLAYVQGASHAEIAEALGLKAASIRLLLFRTRKQLAQLLRSDA